MEVLFQGGLTNTEIAEIMQCNERTVRKNRCKWDIRGKIDVVRSPQAGRLKIMPYLEEHIKEFLTSKPDSDLHEVREFLYWEHDVAVDVSTIGKHLKRLGWSNKKMRLVAAQRDEELREAWVEELRALYEPNQLVYVDESGCDKRDGARRYGWSPKGVTPEGKSKLERGQRYHLLPAITIDGLLDAFVYPGQTNMDGFVNWVRDRVLPQCQRYPGPRSVLVMDNASWHHCEELTHLCEEFGVKLVYLPPYSPDLNPIEAFFKDFKALLRRRYARECGDSVSPEEFVAFLEAIAWEVSRNVKGIRGHFRQARVNFERFDEVAMASQSK